MLTDATPLWETTGFTASGTTHVIDHPDAGGTTAGSTLLLMMVARPTATITPPSSWSADQAAIAYRYSNTAGGETSWTFTSATTTVFAYWFAEYEHLAPVDSLDASATAATATVSDGTVKSTNTTPLNAGSQVLAISVYSLNKAGTTDVNSWSSWTNGFTERCDIAPASGSTGPQVAVAAKVIDGVGTFSTAATFATTVGTAQSNSAYLLLYRDVDASINAPLDYFTGYEWGTHGGMENVIGGFYPDGVGPFGGSTVWDTHYAIEAGAAYDSGFGMRVTANGVASVPRKPVMPSIGNKGCFGFHAKPVSGSGTPVVAYIVATGQDIYLRYDVTNEKFGLEWLGGSTVWQTGTTPLGTQPWIDIGVLANSTTHHLEWWIDTGTGDGSQTSPADLTGQSVGSSLQLFWGNAETAAPTYVIHFDNPVQSRLFAAHPLKPHRVVAAVPEGTGATVSGTSTNFSRFTANGTLAALTVDTVGTLLDDIPPTISASADGIVQTATAASDYVNLPMTPPTLAQDEIIAGVRFVAALWGGTGSGTGNLGWRGHDGLTETMFVDAAAVLYDAGSGTAISSTHPPWNSAMWSGASNGAWTPARLADAAVRMGFSTDATPDMGASAVYLEVAIRKAPTVRTLTIDEPVSVAVDIIVNPYHSGTVSYVITNNDAVQTATFKYSVSGTPQTPVTVAPLDSEIVDIHAAAFGDISDIGVTAD